MPHSYSQHDKPVLLDSPVPECAADRTYDPPQDHSRRPTVMTNLSQETELFAILLGQTNDTLHLLVVDTNLLAEILDHCTQHKTQRYVN